MSVAVVIALIAAVLMIGSAAILWLGAPGQEGHSRISERLEAWASLHPHDVERRLGNRSGVVRIAWLAPLLQRAGITLTNKLQSILIAIPVILVPLLAIFVHGLVAAVLLLLYPLALYGLLRWKIRQFARALVAQLPSYLDAVVRSLAVGNSMPIALKLSMEQSVEPILQVFRQVVQRQALGVSIENALEQVAAMYQVRELTLMASAVTINSRYGGRLEAVLGSIANSIREYDRAQRELVAMTAETRLSAWILSALPILIGLMMGAANPDYIRGMWLDTSGRWMLIAAISLDIAGTIILLRMARV